VIEPQFDDAWDFSEGLAQVKKGDKWGYINKEGIFIVEPQFEEGGYFSEGFALIKKDNKWGYIKKNGSIAIEPQFTDAWDFSEGAGRIKQNGLYGIITEAGEIIIKPQFDDMYDFSEGVVAVKENGLYGFILNPVSGKNKEKILDVAGLLTGVIKSVSAGEIIVGGSNISGNVCIGDKLCIFSGENLIILRSTFPMMTVTKCEIVSGSRKEIKTGMKVYKYKGGEKKKKVE